MAGRQAPWHREELLEIDCRSDVADVAEVAVAAEAMAVDLPVAGWDANADDPQRWRVEGVPAPMPAVPAGDPTVPEGVSAPMDLGNVLEEGNLIFGVGSGHDGHPLYLEMPYLKEGEYTADLRWYPLLHIQQEWSAIMAGKDPNVTMERKLRRAQGEMELVKKWRAKLKAAGLLSTD